MFDLQCVDNVKQLPRLPAIKNLHPTRRRPHHREGGQARHPLVSPTRRSILAQIAAAPGIRGRELVERPGVGRGGLRYHVLRLQDEGLIVRLGHGCYLTEKGVLELDRFRLLKSANAMALASALSQGNRGATLESLGKRAGTNPATTRHYMRRLAGVELATIWWGGKAYYGKCTAEGRRFIQLLTGDLRGRSAKQVVAAVASNRWERPKGRLPAKMPVRSAMRFPHFVASAPRQPALADPGVAGLSLPKAR